jgi:tripartite-type tricarboxylate transporter receptor subunit TctC
MRVRRLVLMGILLASALPMVTASAVAQAPYPNRPIRLIVPFPAGGGADLVGRLVAQSLGERVGVPIIVENRAGAATNLGMDAVAKAAPDGYTLGLTTSNLAINPHLYPNMPYDPKRDVVPVGLLSKGLYVLVVAPGVEAKSVKELVALAKAKPDSLNAAIAGFGTPGHLALAQFNAMTGANIRSVPYQGAAPAINSLLSNTTQLLFISLASSLPQVKAGKLRMLAITSSAHSADVPEVPNSTEAGLPGVEIVEWYGLVAPAKVDPAQIAFLAGELRKVLDNADVQQKIKIVGAEAAPATPSEFGKFIESQTTMLGNIVRSTGLKME